MIDDILDNRPKPQTNTAVEEWLKHNKPTVLADFERVKPKSKHRTHKSDPKLLRKADAVVSKIRNEGLTYKRFLTQCNHDQALMRQIKAIIKQEFGMSLVKKTKTIQVSKRIEVMELSR